MATSFQECVAMDLKFYKGKILLHLIDHATRLSVSSFVKSKEPETILNGIFKSWIQIYGAPEKFLTDNGGEFANSNFIDMAELMNIMVKVTAAESPFSNGLVERHNLIIADMMDKVLEDPQNINIDLALAWCINAKNSLANVHGFSPFQLALGQNPKLPSTFTDKPPAFLEHNTSKVLTDNLMALHKAREAFISSEPSEKICRALNNNVRSSGDFKYVTGDSVYFKKVDEKRWRGPGKVLGQDGQQVLVKYGSRYVRVHPCRMSLARDNNKFDNHDTTQAVSTPVEEIPTVDKKKENNYKIVSDSDSEDEIHKQPDNTDTPQNQLDDIANLSASLERLSVTQDCLPMSNQETPTIPALRKNLKVKFRFRDDNKWRTATLISRAGKATGKYNKEWNSKIDDERIRAVDFECDVSDIEIIPKNSRNCNQSVDEIRFSETYLTALQNEANKAKIIELESWRNRETYSEEDDLGQSCISVRWVLTRKFKNGESFIKARLCARGFEEMNDFPTDSPCCSRISVRSIFALIASNQWKVQAIDVKTAFLQGKQIERTIYLRPPKEANTAKIWRLLKCVYGLSDASRYWYLRVKEELIKLGAIVSSVDPALFFWEDNNNLIGILACHVDDMIWGGNENFKLNIIDKLKNIFTFGSEETDAFTYLGIQLSQDEDYSVVINQSSYINGISEIELTKERKERNSSLTNEEKTLYRSAVGQLNWVAGMSRPDISFSVCEASTKFKQATIADVIYVNKIIRNLKNSNHVIKFPQLNLENLKLQLFTDACYNNLPNGGSQGGQIIFLTDDKNNTCAFYWNSSRIKRVVRSTISAETLSLSEGCDVAIYVDKLVSELLYHDGKLLDITAYTNNQSLYDAAHSTKQTLEKRLLVDNAAIREMIERNEINVAWIEKNKQISDVLTKAGASPNIIHDVLSSSKMIEL